MSEVRPGYKQTESGVIPEDWEVKTFSEVFDFLDGIRKPVKDSERAKMQGSIPYYGASGVVDYVNDFLFDEKGVINIHGRTGKDKQKLPICPSTFPRLLNSYNRT